MLRSVANSHRNPLFVGTVFFPDGTQGCLF